MKTVWKGLDKGTNIQLKEVFYSSMTRMTKHWTKKNGHLLVLKRRSYLKVDQIIRLEKV